MRVYLHVFSERIAYPFSFTHLHLRLLRHTHNSLPCLFLFRSPCTCLLCCLSSQAVCFIKSAKKHSQSTVSTSSNGIPDNATLSAFLCKVLKWVAKYSLLWRPLIYLGKSKVGVENMAGKCCVFFAHDEDLPGWPHVFVSVAETFVTVCADVSASVKSHGRLSWKWPIPVNSRSIGVSLLKTVFLALASVWRFQDFPSQFCKMSKREMWQKLLRAACLSSLSSKNIICRFQIFKCVIFIYFLMAL